MGSWLAELLVVDGASLVVADIDAGRAVAVAAATGAEAEMVAIDALGAVAMDIFAPCALSVVLSAETSEHLGAKAVVGGANNQLATPDCDERLRAAGVL